MSMQKNPLFQQNIHYIYYCAYILSIFRLVNWLETEVGVHSFFCRADLGENGLYISFFLDVDLLFVWRASRNTARPLLTFFLLLVMSTVYINNKRRDILFFFIFNFFFLALTYHRLRFSAGKLSFPFSQIEGDIVLPCHMCHYCLKSRLQENVLLCNMPCSLYHLVIASSILTIAD